MQKKLYRLRDGRVLLGVCAGIGNYFHLDPVLIRLAWILFSLLGGSGILAYLVAAVLIPEDTEF